MYALIVGKKMNRIEILSIEEQINCSKWRAYKIATDPTNLLTLSMIEMFENNPFEKEEMLDERERNKRAEIKRLVKNISKIMRENGK